VLCQVLGHTKSASGALHVACMTMVVRGVWTAAGARPAAAERTRRAVCCLLCAVLCAACYIAQTCAVPCWGGARGASAKWRGESPLGIGAHTE
jgi:hypothetical protein